MSRARTTKFLFQDGDYFDRITEAASRVEDLHDELTSAYI